MFLPEPLVSTHQSSVQKYNKLCENKSAIEMDCFSCNGNPNSNSESSSIILSNHGKQKKKGNGNNTSKAVVRLSTDPQSVAARERRHRISDRFKILQSLVPGGTKMDTVSMLEEAINYVKFLKAQIWLHQTIMVNYVEGDPFLFRINPPTQQQQQQLPLCSPENLATAHEIQSAPPLGLPDSGSQGEEEPMFFDGSMNY